LLFHYRNGVRIPQFSDRLICCGFDLCPVRVPLTAAVGGRKTLLGSFWTASAVQHARAAKTHRLYRSTTPRRRGKLAVAITETLCARLAVFYSVVNWSSPASVACTRKPCYRKEAALCSMLFLRPVTL